MTLQTRRRDDFRPDPRLLPALSGALFLGVIALLSLPAARGDSVVFGSMPLWLVGMPLAALAAWSAAWLAHRARPMATMAGSTRQRAATRMQARRRGSTSVRARAGLPRAA